MQAERLAADLNRRFPKATYVQLFCLPGIRAAIALHQGRPAEAIESLRAEAQYELTSCGMFGTYLRGQAYLSMVEVLRPWPNSRRSWTIRVSC